jgi:hypothetical protein
MSYIAHLDLSINRSLQDQRWCDLARELGTPLLDYSGPPGNLAPIVDFIRNSDGMILPYENFLTTPELVDAIQKRVKDGGRLLVRIGPNNVDQLNPFLDPYGIQGTRVALHDPAGGRMIELEREEGPDAFGPHELLDGVDSLVLELTNAISYSGGTLPIITLPADRFLVVDQQTDFPADWTSPQISCMVLAPHTDEGGVLATSSGFFIHDPYESAGGILFPGITGASNRMLAGNVLRWLAGHSATRSYAEHAFHLVDRIERSLVEFTVRRLESALADWWTDGVPVSVRKKCSERQEDEGNKLPRGAYLDIVDVKTILEVPRNWKIFEKDLRMVGWTDKKAALSWIPEFNDIRRNVMHPTRRHFKPNLLDQASISKLRTWLRKVEKLGIQTAIIQ